MSKNPQDKEDWPADEPAAEVVRKIYALCLDGRGPSQIARQLEQEKVLIPTAYARMSVNYENEQRTLINKVAEDEKKLACIEQTSLDLKTLLKAAEDEIKSLTAKIKANPQEYRLTA